MSKVTYRKYKITRGKRSGRIRSRRPIGSIRTRGSIYRKRGIGKKLKSIKVKHDSITTSFNKSYNLKNTYMRKMASRYWNGARNLNQFNISQVMTIPLGGQVYTEQHLMNYAQIINALSAVGLQPSATGNVKNTARIFLNSIRGLFNFTNSSNGNVFVDLYEFVCHRDTTSGVALLWQQSMKNESAQIVTDYTTTYGANPLMSGVSVNTFWRAKKVIHVELPPGASHEQHFEYHVCSPYNNALFDSNVDVDTSFRGLTRSYLIVCRGAAISGSGTGTGVDTTATANIQIAGSATLDWKYIQDQDTNYSFSSTGAYVGGTFKTIAGNVYNQGSGASAAQTAY